MRTTTRTVSTILFVLTAAMITQTTMAQDKPNILVIWGDNIGITNISAYSHGLMD